MFSLVGWLANYLLPRPVRHDTDESSGTGDNDDDDFKPAVLGDIDSTLAVQHTDKYCSLALSDYRMVGDDSEESCHVDSKSVCNEESSCLDAPRCKIFVGNISYRINKKQLADFFTKFGEVRFCQIVSERFKNRSKGIGFVGFKTQEEVHRALNASPDCLVLDDRQMRVHLAEEKRRVTARKEKIWYPEETPLYEFNGDECYVNNLPDDCLGLVFLKLSFKERIKIERVCKRWRTVALSTWPAVNSLHFKGFFARFGGLTDRMLLSILSKRGCSNLKTLDLSHSPRLLTDWCIEIIGRNCPGLKSLNLSNVLVTNLSLKELGKKCSRLERIILRNCHDVGEKGVWWLFHKCKNLSYVDCSHLKKFSGKCFHMLGPNMKQAVLNESVLVDEGISLLSARSNSLTELHINECLKITDKGIHSLAQVCSSLQVLQAKFVPAVSSHGWMGLKQLSALTELHVPRNLNISNDVLVAIGKGCRSLKYLDISGCHRDVTDSGVSRLAPCSHLEVLKISYLDKVGNDSLWALSIACPLKKLEARGCSLVTDRGLSDMAVHCFTLEEVDVCGCYDVSSQTVSEFVSSQLLLGAVRPLELVVGGTSIEKFDEDVLVSANITLNLQDLCVYHFMPKTMAIQLAEWFDDDDSDAEEYKELDEGLQQDHLHEEAWCAAGNETEDIDWSDSCNIDNGWQEAWLEADDPVYDDYWNPS